MINPDQPVSLSPDIPDEQLTAICEAVQVIACDCPGYLARLLQGMREFKHYTESCIQQYPEDAATHQWLSEQIQESERLVSEIIFELLQREQLIDESNQLHLGQLAARARAIALQQAKL